MLINKQKNYTNKKLTFQKTDKPSPKNKHNLNKHNRNKIIKSNNFVNKLICNWKLSLLFKNKKRKKQEKEDKCRGDKLNQETLITQK